MCYGPYEHNAMLRDIAARTAGVRVPKLRLVPALAGLVARLSLWCRAFGHRIKASVSWRRSV